jgi:tRNA A37 methylthiotransferase MiaB
MPGLKLPKVAIIVVHSARYRLFAVSIDRGPWSEFVEEAKTLISRGFRELDIISQDIMSYGQDLTESGDYQI